MFGIAKVKRSRVADSPNTEPPNNACIRLVGLAAFSSSFCGLELVPSKQRYLVPPTSGYPAENLRGRPRAVSWLKRNYEEVAGKTVTRKKLVTALSIIYILNGVWDIGIFLSPLASSPKSIELDLAPLIGGALALYVGFYLLRFDEFGRKLAIFLLFVRVAVNSAFMVWAFSHQNEFIGSGLYFLEEQIYRLDNPYAFQVFLFVWIIIALLAIIFLSHKETKKIFLPEQSNDSNKIIESA